MKALGWGDFEEASWGTGLLLVPIHGLIVGRFDSSDFKRRPPQDIFEILDISWGSVAATILNGTTANMYMYGIIWT